LLHKLRGDRPTEPIVLNFGKRTLQTSVDVNEHKPEHVPLAINEAQLVLAEMRTSLAVMRTGIAVLALPLSVISVLIATSKYYDVFHVLHLLIPLGILNSALICLGVYLIVRSLGKIRHYEHLIREIKLKHSIIGEFIF
jgi:uncharacterized membrane protein YidH (DUF202 family)